MTDDDTFLELVERDAEAKYHEGNLTSVTAEVVVGEYEDDDPNGAPLDFHGIEATYVVRGGVAELSKLRPATGVHDVVKVSDFQAVPATTVCVEDVGDVTDVKMEGETIEEMIDDGYGAVGYPERGDGGE